VIGLSFVSSFATVVIASNGKPRSRILINTPCSAAWSDNGPRSTAWLLASLLMVMLSNQADQVGARCSWAGME
jgi:hypothetical protein